VVVVPKNPVAFLFFTIMLFASPVIADDCFGSSDICETGHCPEPVNVRLNGDILSWDAPHRKD